MLKLEDQAREEIARLGGNPALIQLLDYMHVNSEPGDDAMPCNVQ